MGCILASWSIYDHQWCQVPSCWISMHQLSLIRVFLFLIFPPILNMFKPFKAGILYHFQTSEPTSSCFHFLFLIPWTTALQPFQQVPKTCWRPWCRCIRPTSTTWPCLLSRFAWAPGMWVHFRRMWFLPFAGHLWICLAYWSRFDRNSWTPSYHLEIV